MRKLLGLLGVFVLTASAASPMMACSIPASESTYETVEDAIKALKLISYAINGTKDVDKVAADIRQDAINILLTNNYALGVTFGEIDKDKLILDKTKVINNSTKAALKPDDLVSDTVLSLELAFTYVGKDVEAASSTLDITTKSDQEIDNYISGYDFNKDLLKSPPAPVRLTVANFQGVIKNWLLSPSTFGSFSTFINTASFIINSDDIKKGNVDLSQDDLNKPGTLGITVNYKYAEIDKQSISFNVNIKIYISKATVTYEELTIPLPDKTKAKLSELAVTTIKTAITTAIQTVLAKATDDLITTTDYEVTGIETIVKKGADFTNQTPVTFTIIVKSDSPKFTGKLDKQTIKVTVTDKP